MKYVLAVLLLIGLTLPTQAAEPAAKKKAAPKEEVASAEAQATAKTLTPTQKAKLMDILNKGDDATLQTLPGIGETRAKAIVKGRPYVEPIDLLKVEGIGDATFARIVAHAKADFPEKKKKAAVKTEGEAKKKAPAKNKEPEAAADKKAAKE